MQEAFCKASRKAGAVSLPTLPRALSRRVERHVGNVADRLFHLVYGLLPRAVVHHGLQCSVDLFGQRGLAGFDRDRVRTFAERFAYDLEISASLLDARPAAMASSAAMASACPIINAVSHCGYVSRSLTVTSSARFRTL